MEYIILNWVRDYFKGVNCNSEIFGNMHGV